jgi:hypothetical protein
MTVEGHEAELSVADEVRGKLDFERTRHASLEQRGAMVISTTGALITLLFAVAGVTAKSSDSRVIGLPLFFTWSALICLVFAAFLGIYLNVANTADIKSVPMPVLEELVKSGGMSKMHFIHKQMDITKKLVQC